MKYIPLFITLLISLISTAQTPDEFAQYKALNDAETRLSEFKDDDFTLQLKVAQLAIINQSRKKHKAQPVALDIFASRVANKMAQEAAQNDYMGHFNLAGQTPYMRYGLEGGRDHIIENASAYSSSTTINVTSEEIAAMMKQLHAAFMAERAPNDGHKKACIDPTHNFVGLGIAWHDKEFRYYEEYLDRYLTFNGPSTTIKSGSNIEFDVTPLLPNHHLYAMLVYYQPEPKPMKPKAISAIGSYSDFTETQLVNMAPWELPQPDAQGTTHLSIPTSKKGIYYIHLFLDDKPYTKGKASTTGKILGSGIVVRVE